MGEILCYETIYKKYEYQKKNIGGNGMDRLYITDAADMGNLTVSLTFNDNTVQTVDVGEFIRKHPHPQYNKYLNPVNFRKGKLVDGNVVWGNDLEFHIHDLYSGKLS